MKFYASQYMSIATQLARLSRDAEKYRNDPFERLAYIGGFADHLQDIAKQLTQIGCSVSASASLKLGRDMTEEWTHETLDSRMDALSENIQTEMSMQLFLQVPTQRAGFYEGTEESFGVEVRYRFPKALPEIRSAGECLALGCYTASVFHLMRVMELGLKAVGKSLGIVINVQDGWERILEKVGKEEIKKDESANAKMLGELAFYKTVRGTVAAVKESCRNRTMHLDATWDERDAYEILTSVRAFLRGIAAKIDEDRTLGGPGPLQPNEILF